MDDAAGLEYRVARLEDEVRDLRAMLGPRHPFRWTPPPPAAQPGPPPPTPRPESELEASFFGTWFARLGAMAIVIGLAFGFTYAIEQGWLTAWMRVTLGWGVGLGALAWGHVMAQRRYRSVGHAVIAGGIGLLYLATLAAMLLYDLFPVTVGLLVLTAIATGGGLLALRHDSLPLAVMASLAAFGVAALIGFDRGNPSTVYACTTVVNLGVLGMVLARCWVILAPVAVAASCLLMALRLDEARPVVTLSFGTLWLLMFCGASLFGAARASELERGDVAVLVATSFAYLALGNYVFSSLGYQAAMGAFTAALSVSWAAIGLAARRGPLERAAVSATAWGLCVAFAVLAVPAQFDGASVGVGWALQGALLAWIARRRGAARLQGPAAFVCSLGFLAGLYRLADIFWAGRPLWSSDTIVVCLHLAGLVAAAYWFERADSQEGLQLGRAAGAMAALLGLGWVSAEVLVYGERLDAGEQTVQFGLSAAWALYAAAFLCGGILARRSEPRILALVLLATVMVKLILLDLWLLPALLRTASFVGLGILLLLCSLMYHRLLPTLLGHESQD
ncbi:MAG: DUF2339 domain-containing protein [Actinomycetota bacterium]